MNVSIPIPDNHPRGVNWYHVHRHKSTHPQVYGGLAGLLLVGDPLDPGPQYKGTITQVNMALSEVNIQDGPLSNYNAAATGPTSRGAGRSRSTARSTRRSTSDRARPRSGTSPRSAPFGGVQPGDHRRRPAEPLERDPAGAGRQRRERATLLAVARGRPRGCRTSARRPSIMPGNRLTMAVTAPTTPGTYYLIDGWGGQDKPAVDGKGQQQLLRPGHDRGRGRRR